MGGFDPVGTPNTVHHPSGLATTPQNAFWTVPAGCTQRSFLRAGWVRETGSWGEELFGAEVQQDDGVVCHASPRHDCVCWLLVMLEQVIQFERAVMM